MAENEKKSILLNLAGDLGTDLMGRLSIFNLEILEPATLSEEMPDFVLVRDNFKAVSSQYKDAVIITFEGVEDIMAFAESNGRAVINEKILSSSVAIPILQRLFNCNVSTKLEANFGTLLEDFLTLKISGHMNVGHFSDMVVNDAFSRDFRAISLRAFLVFMSTYVAYMERGGLCQYPVDLNYGANGDSYVIELVVPAPKFYLEYIYPSLGNSDARNPLKHLLRECMSMSDFLSITHLQHAGKLVISAVWLKSNIPPAFGSLSFCAIDSVNSAKRRWLGFKKHPDVALSTSHEIQSINEKKPLPGPGLQKIGPLHERLNQTTEGEDTQIVSSSEASAEEILNKVGKRQEFMDQVIARIEGLNLEDVQDIVKVNGKVDIDESKIVVHGDDGPIDLTDDILKVSGNSENGKITDEVIKVHGDNEKRSQSAKWIFKNAASSDQDVSTWNDKRGKIVAKLKEKLAKMPEENFEVDSVQQNVQEVFQEEFDLSEDPEEKGQNLNKAMKSISQTIGQSVVSDTLLRVVDNDRKINNNEVIARIAATPVVEEEEDVEVKLMQSDIEYKNEQIKKMKQLMDSMRDQMVSMVKKAKINQSQFQTMNESILQLREELVETKNKVSERDFKLRTLEMNFAREQAGEGKTQENIISFAENDSKALEDKNMVLEQEVANLKDAALHREKIAQTQSRILNETITQLKQEVTAAKIKIGEREFKLRDLEKRLSIAESLELPKAATKRAGADDDILDEDSRPIRERNRELEDEIKVLKDADVRKDRQVDKLKASVASMEKALAEAQKNEAEFKKLQKSHLSLQGQLSVAQDKAEALTGLSKVEMPKPKEAPTPTGPTFLAPAQVLPHSSAEQRNMMTLTQSLQEKDLIIAKLNAEAKQAEIRQKDLGLEVKRYEQKLKMTMVQMQSMEKQKGKKGFGSKPTATDTQLQHKVKQLEAANAQLAETQKSVNEDLNEKKKEVMKLKQELNTMQNTLATLERKLSGKEKDKVA